MTQCVWHLVHFPAVISHLTHLPEVTVHSNLDGDRESAPPVGLRHHVCHHLRVFDEVAAIAFSHGPPTQMCVCVCLYVCVCACMTVKHTHTHTHVYMHIHPLHIHAHTHTPAHAYIHRSTHTVYIHETQQQGRSSTK